MNNEVCYKCGAPANTREHVPPLCLFPASKDFPNTDFRKNLITVPSCKLHNSAKSKDDEVLMAALAGVVGNNEVGYIQTKTKVKRIYDRNGEDYINNIFKKTANFTFTTEEGKKFPLAIGQPHHSRLRSSFEHIAYGLYFFEKHEVFRGRCVILLGFVTFQDINHNKYLEAIQRRVELELPTLKQKGSNPRVFKYWILEPDEQGLIGMKMTFYEGSDVYVCFIKEGIEPQKHFAHSFINAGIKTIVEFPDGKPPIEFN